MRCRRRVDLSADGDLDEWDLFLIDELRERLSRADPDARTYTIEEAFSVDYACARRRAARRAIQYPGPPRGLARIPTTSCAVLLRGRRA
jgi:hypothetical protein